MVGIIPKNDPLKPYFVYILECYSGFSSTIYYTGLTNNIKRRLREHKNGRSRYTHRFNGNIVLIYLETGYGTPTKKASTWAYHREREIKSFSRKKKEQLVEDNQERTKQLCNEFLI